MESRFPGALAAVVGGASVLVLPGVAASERAAAVSARPVADAYVSAAAPRRSFGRAKTLVVSSRPRQRAYLRFRVPRTRGPVRSARLRLFVRGGGGTLKVASVRSNRWTERTIAYRNAPAPARASATARARRGRWSELDVTRIVSRSGLMSLAVGSGGGRVVLGSRESRSRAPRLVLDVGATVSETVIAAAGNIACDPLSPSYNGGAGTPSECQQRATSDLLVGGGLGGVLTLGDAQYACGGFQAYQQVFGATWGRVKGLIHPVLGNHDYRPGPLAGTDCDPGGQPSGYFRYFGAAAGNPSSGYYSFDVGGWHLVALNTNCDLIGCGPGSAQEAWLRADLGAHPTRCTLAFMHHPRFSSSYEQARNTQLDAIWRALYAARVEVVLAAHDHVYERFAPQDPAGRADPNGIREFVVGTGGFSHHPFFTVQAGSEARNNTSFGVLRLTLRASGYGWQFVAAAGSSFTDSGSGSCR